LLYENDVKFCVVTGPITKPRKAEDEQLYHADSHLVFPVKGCLLICQGLISAPHLNGELGIARGPGIWQVVENESEVSIGQAREFTHGV